MIRGKTILLRPFTQADIPFFDERTNDFSFHGEFNNFGLHSPGRMGNALAENGLLSARHGNLVITTLDGQIIGDVSYHQQSYGPNEASLAYNIGIAIAAEHRGKGYGTEAQQLLAAYLFSTYPVMRVEATTDIENIAEQRSLEKANFTREGVIRRAQWRAGNWHDMVLYSKLRGE
jgi:RimJ/RimL family protein N-acetyltransferase